jgi:phosphoglucomutase
MPIDTLTINTAPISGQKPGTSGLRKRTREFEAGNYLPNYVQSVFDACGDLAGKTIVVGGDGRYFNSVAIQVILKMAAANGIAKVYVAKDGLLATPAASAVIRKRKAHGEPTPQATATEQAVLARMACWWPSRCNRMGKSSGPLNQLTTCLCVQGGSF